MHSKRLKASRAFRSVQSHCLFWGSRSLARGWGRATQFHPASSESYTAFLRTTPWNALKRLPWGTPCLCWADLPVLGVIALLAALEVPYGFHWTKSVAAVLAAFSLGYAASPLRFSQTKRGALYASVLILLVPLIPLAFVTTWTLLLFSVVILGIGQMLVRDSEDDNREQQQRQVPSRRPRELTAPAAGTDAYNAPPLVCENRSGEAA